MKLKYSMLWFDDDKDQFDSYDFDDLIRQIKSWGFDFDSPTYVQTAQGFMDKAPFTEFDLIVVDYNIGEDNKHGDDFIQKVRDLRIYTEVVFYTARDITKLWESVKEKRLEGVFLSNASMIIQKVLQVAKQSVKKVVDLENMRGIVMAQVGDIDLIIKDLLEKGLTQLGEAKLAEVFCGFINRNKEFSEKNFAKIQQFSEDPSIERMLELCDSSYPIWLLVKSLQKRHPNLKGFDISDYNDEILKPRNALAHGIPQSRNKEFSEKNFAKIQQFSEDPSIERMLELCDSSYPIWLLVKSLQKRHPNLKGFDISDYNDEILKPRNALAHGIPQSQDEGVQIFNYRGYEFRYSDDSAQQIRNDLKKYIDIYGNMKNKVS